MEHLNIIFGIATFSTIIAGLKWMHASMIASHEAARQEAQKNVPNGM